jgi:hypothetical protein
MDGKQRESTSKIQPQMDPPPLRYGATGCGFTQIGDREWTRNDGNVFGAAASLVRKPGAKGIFAALAKYSPIRRRAHSPFRNIGPAGFEPPIRQMRFH